MYLRFLKSLLCCSLFVSLGAKAQSTAKNNFTVTAYYAGGPQQVDSFAVEKLTHIIFSFCHLQGNRLHVANAKDSTTIRKLVALKSRNPQLKVLLSLGGWGGCASCSDVFASSTGRKEFARSVKELTTYFGADGIDLDWEYPAIAGYPGHKYQPADKQNFTHLVKDLRKALGKKAEISFAAGGFPKFVQEAVEWKKVMKRVDRVNLMTYDLVSGYATVTGHHTPLYSTGQQVPSTDNAVQALVRQGIPRNKLVIGAAFYGRMWEKVANKNNGLYQAGVFKAGIAYKDFPAQLSAQQGFTYYWDDTAKAPYLYNAAQQLFVTFDDHRSVQLKTKYALDQKLNGIMFWELANDAYSNGLLDAIDSVQKKDTAAN